MDFTSFLLKLGIFSYVYQLETVITARNEIQIGDTISTDLGWIYGISTEVNGVSPKDQVILLPTVPQISGLYLNLKVGQTFFETDYRMSNFVFVDPIAIGNVSHVNPKRYLEVSVPLNIDLKKSIIRNPLAQFGFSTLINFHYITKLTYNKLVEKGILMNYEMGTVGSK